MGVRSLLTNGGRRSKETELRVPVLPRWPWQLVTEGKEREGGGRGKSICSKC